MSLRTRLLAAVVASLLISVMLGGSVAVWHASRSLATELRAALRVGAQSVANALEQGTEPELLRLVRTFDGDRHVRATLRDRSGAALAASVPLVRPAGAPDWFVALLARPLPPVRIVAGGAELLLTADPRSEAGETWTELRDGMVAVVLFCALSLGLVGLTLRRALAPLDALSAALASLGAGRFETRLPAAGPRELAPLADAFNTMSQQLEAAQTQNERLGRQLTEIAEEERAELARDLHDEVGPFLFSVRLDAAAIERAAERDGLAPLLERAQAIREATVHMQHHVRVMLSRLRGADPAIGGLEDDLASLVGFWRSRQPAISFALRVAGPIPEMDEPLRTAVYRMAQEGLTNAVRHGNPRRVAVTLEADPERDVLVRIEDDGTGFPPAGKHGWGLTGMRERISALGGTLDVGPGGAGRGLRLEARLPAERAEMITT